MRTGTSRSPWRVRLLGMRRRRRVHQPPGRRREIAKVDFRVQSVAGECYVFYCDGTVHGLTTPLPHINRSKLKCDRCVPALRRC